MQMKNDLYIIKHNLISTNMFIHYYCKLHDIDIDIDEYTRVIEQYKDTIEPYINTIYVYPYVYILHTLYHNNRSTYKKFLQHFIILVKNYDENIVRQLSQFKDDNIDVIIRYIFKDIIIIYFIAFIQYYFL